MSLKQEIETWVLALEHYDHQEYEEAIRIFGHIADTSKIYFNCGVIYATLGEHEKAVWVSFQHARTLLMLLQVQCYQRAVGLDQYLAIAYFQEGVSNFLLGDFEEALANFNDTLLYLRGNTSIDYEQLGLKFRLFSCEVLFNRGLCYIYLQQMGPGMQDLEYAGKEKVTPDHDVINDAIREKAEGYTVFSIPVGVIYRPNEAKVKNLKTKDYLGKARLIAASSRGNTPPDPTRAQAAIDDRPPENISYGATNLVQKNITGRSRQQSEPPLNRTFFPPTPPPDADKASTKSSSGSSMGATGRPGSMRAARPPRLNLDRPGAQIQGRSSTDVPAQDKPRIGTTRTASEPRGPPCRQYPRGPNGLETDRNPSFREIGGHRRNASDTGFAPSAPAAYEDDGFGVYSGTRSMNGGRRGVPQQRYIDEEEEYEGVGGHERVPRDGAEGSENSQRRTRSPTRESRRADSRRPSVHRFRIKVHAFEDTRYIMIGPTIEYGEFETRIREKFGFRALLRIRMQDEGDMITMVDQEDLDLLLSSATETAQREGSEMGKMEIWVEERPMI
ncbi:putative PB1 domain protein [Aspergillus clavatus NRRL 1]|uniref:PB1 domain protein, putative n=1 Tax=Aspergillus clavatus (strain ATCC 1007 / CBS 513.65 / DSM 816 / NCTC 3887 / NRRL 1 / QM 1276 / 107) TaxID=344612 RepID=A1C627_ASPCL|nr:PB1 domain protein, putative [Aspergillus clavatus NRRL 1]EAW13848.1 PB1 domain protein, putative [Aspergillus clavatus NRRL 1]